MLRTTFRKASLALAGILIGIAGCAESPSAPAARPEFQFLAAPTTGPSFARSGGSSSAVIGPEGGMLTTASGHSIVFPAGALAEPTEITIRSDTRYAGVELEPHGLEFPEGYEPVLSLNLGNASLLSFLQLNVVYVNEGGRILEILPTSVGGQRMETRLHHFSRYIGAAS